MLSYFSDAIGATDTVQDKRVCVLQQHVQLLTQQAEARQAELASTHAQLAQQAKAQQMTQTQERKLFARVESLQAELKQAREHKAKAEQLASTLQTQVEKVVRSAEAEESRPGEQLLLRTTTEQLECTQALLQHTQGKLLDAEKRFEITRREVRSAEGDREAADQRELAAQKRLDSYVSKLREGQELTLAAVEKGSDLEEQHHILQLSFLTVKAELARRTVARDALAKECESLRQQLDTRISDMQQQHRKTRDKQVELQKEADAAMEAVRAQLERHIESLEEIRKSLLELDGKETKAKSEYEEMVKQLQASHDVHVKSIKERAVTTYREREEQTAQQIQSLEAELQAALDRVASAEVEARESQESSEALRIELQRVQQSVMLAAKPTARTSSDSMENGAPAEEMREVAKTVAQLREQLDEALLQAASAQEEREAARHELATTASELERARETQRQLEELNAEHRAEQERMEHILQVAQHELAAEKEVSSSLRQREAALAEEVVRERMAKQEATERLDELRKQASWQQMVCKEKVLEDEGE
ncbi:MAG: hypothetical protein SGPRY_005298 [Prymnesium sp.]